MKFVDKKIIVRGFLPILAGLLLSACGQTESAAGAAGSSAPADDQKLIVYTAHKEEVYRPIIEEFENTTGIWVDVKAGGTTEMLRRIREEGTGENGGSAAKGASGEETADIMFGGGAENLETFKSYFSPYHSSAEEQLDSNFVSKDGSWTPFTELPIVFIYNNKLVSEENAPGSWREFLDGTWKGQISFADPEKSGTSITILETLKLVNEQQQWETDENLLLKQFADNLDGHLAGGSGEVLSEVSSGERMVGITLEETALKEMARGHDIAMRYPEEGTSAVPDCVAIVKDAPHPENAERFVDFVIDLPVQKYVETNLYRRSVRTDVKETVRGSDLLTGMDVGTLRILDFDVTAASREERDVLEQFLAYLDGVPGEESGGGEDS